MIEPTDAQIRAAIDAMPGDFEIISEDDNRYCNPPRTRYLTDDEEYAGVRDMLIAAFSVQDRPPTEQDVIGLLMEYEGNRA